MQSVLVTSTISEKIAMLKFLPWSEGRLDSFITDLITVDVQDIVGMNCCLVMTAVILTTLWIRTAHSHTDVHHSGAMSTL